MNLLYILLLPLLFLNVYSYADDANLNKKITECNQLVKSGNEEKALEYTAQLLKQNKPERDIFLCQSRAQMSLRRFADAVISLKSVDQLSIFPNDHMMALAMLGNAYKGNNQFNEAIGAYELSLNIAITLKNTSFQRITHGLIGDVQSNTKHFDEAVTNYQAAIKLSLNDNERADAFEHLASIFSQQQKYNLAIEYQLKATLAYTHYGDLDSQANSGLELGRIYMEAGEYEQAEKSINKILKLAKDNGGPYWEAKSNLLMARLRLSERQNPQIYIDASLRINKELNDASLKDDIAAVLGMVSQ